MPNSRANPAGAGAGSSEQLLDRWHRTRDIRDRDELVERYLPLARKLAGRYAHTREPFEDLVQVASLGLVKAVERFDPEHGSAFASYAIPTILGELKRHFRDTTWSVQVNRRAQERARAVTAAQRVMTAIGRPPTVADLAEFLGYEPDEVLEGLQASQAHTAVSLDAPTTHPDAGSDSAATLFDTIGEADDGLDQVEDRVSLRSALRRLPKLERRILYLRYGEELSQREIASRVGVSQMHVSRLLRRALAGLREHIEPA